MKSVINLRPISGLTSWYLLAFPPAFSQPALFSPHPRHGLSVWPPVPPVLPVLPVRERVLLVEYIKLAPQVCTQNGGPLGPDPDSDANADADSDPGTPCSSLSMSPSSSRLPPKPQLLVPAPAPFASCRPLYYTIVISYRKSGRRKNVKESFRVACRTSLHGSLYIPFFPLFSFFFFEARGWSW